MVGSQDGRPYVDQNQPRASAKPSWRTGQRVIIKGLEKAPELNGHRGVLVKWREDTGRYAVRVAGKEIGIKPENLQAEGGAAVAAQLAKKYSGKVGESGSMYNPEVYARVPGAGPKMTHWIGQVKAGRRTVVRAEEIPSVDELPVPLWFGDSGFVGSSPVDVAILIGDVGEDPSRWQVALGKVLTRFPAAAGRLRRVRQEWKIVLNNAGVPFTSASVPPCGLPAADVLQLACQDDQCGFFDTGKEEYGGEEPLLRLKLIHEEGTARGLLGVSFNHVLCDISGLASLLRSLHSELESGKASDAQPCHDRQAAQHAFDSVSDPSTEQAETFQALWPLWPLALERWCFFARRLRSGLRGRPDGVATVGFAASAAGAAELKALAEASGASDASAFEALVSYLGLRLQCLGRRSRRVLITKDYRVPLEASAPGKGLQQLFANVVTHGLSFELPDIADLEEIPLGRTCLAMREAIDSVSLEYVHWQSKQDHRRGLPNMFAGICCNTWGRALADLDFVEAYAMGMRSLDERAGNMSFPLDAAYLQILPQPSGAHRVLLTMPVKDIENLLKDLPPVIFDVPHLSEMRTHAFRVPLPAQVIDRLNPAVETHHIMARIACVGDSITACGYPKYLQGLFDRADIRVQVRNFGVVGATAQKFSDKPYWEEQKLEAIRVWRPHFVVTAFGTNDAKSSNWDMDCFEKDYKDLCLEFLECSAPRPEVCLVTPPPAYSSGGDIDVQQDVVNKELPDAVVRVSSAAGRAINQPLEEQAKRSRVTIPPEMLARTCVIDAFTLLGGASLTRSSYFAEDGIHPNERGTNLLALTVFAHLRYKVAKYLRKRADEAAAAQPDNPLGL